MPPAPPPADDAAPTPVFVDDSGRRHRAVRVLGCLLGAMMAGYLALLGISLVGSPGLVPLSLPSLGRVLPGPAAPLIVEPSHAPVSTGDLVATAPTAAAPTYLTPAPRTTTSTAPRTLPTTTPRPAATSAATPAPTHSSHPTPQATASSTSRPTHRPSTHPSPRSTKRSAPIASPTPTPTA